jgi:hypothetical protein
MSIVDQIERLRQAKQELYYAITQKGGRLTPEQSISAYPAAVLDIPDNELPVVTVVAENLLEGITAIDSDGNVVTGTMPEVAMSQNGSVITIERGYSPGEEFPLDIASVALEANKLTVTPGYVVETKTFEVPLADITEDGKKVTVGIGYVNEKKEFTIQTVDGAEVQYGYWTDDNVVQLIDVTGDVAQNIVDANGNGKTLSLTPQVFSIPGSTVPADQLTVPLTFTAVDADDSIVGLTLYYSGSSNSSGEGSSGGSKMPVYSVNGLDYTPFFIANPSGSGQILEGFTAAIDVSSGIIVKVQSSSDSEGELSSKDEYYNFRTGAIRDGYEEVLDGKLAASGNVMSLLGFSEACKPYCFKFLFSEAELTTVPLIPATSLANFCYLGMFAGATLDAVPELPATVMAEGCYQRMFEHAKLSTTPLLPATKLAKACYSDMFQGSNITNVVLPAKVLAEGCYNGMFKGCDKLTEIAVHFTAWVEGATEDWVQNVASKGTFYKPAALPEIRGTSYIPAGWDIADIEEFEEFEI